MIIAINKTTNSTEHQIINDITKQIVRYLFSQYLNVSDQPIGFKWSDFNERMNDFCQKHFIKSFDSKSKEEIDNISFIIKSAVNEECDRIISSHSLSNLPTKQIFDEVDLLNSIYFDTTVSLLNSLYHEDYFSNFFEYNTSNETPSISHYLENNRMFIKQQAIERLNILCSNFQIDDIDKKILTKKLDKYYSISL